VDDGFHRSPLVPGCLKVLKYLFPRAVRAAQCHPSNELNRFGGAAQNNRRAGADTQLWIDWKVRHDALTLSRGRSSRWDTKPALSISSAYARKQSRSVAGSQLFHVPLAPRTHALRKQQSSLQTTRKKWRSTRDDAIGRMIISIILSAASICRARSCRADRYRRMAHD